MKEIANEYTAALVDKMASVPVIDTKEAIDYIRDNFVLDIEKAEMREIRRIVGQCAKRITNDNGERQVIMLRDSQKIVNVDLCRDKALTEEAARQIKKQISETFEPLSTFRSVNGKARPDRSACMT